MQPASGVCTRFLTFGGKVWRIDGAGRRGQQGCWDVATAGARARQNLDDEGNTDPWRYL